MLTVSTSFFSQPQLNSLCSESKSQLTDVTGAHLVVHNWTGLAQVRSSTRFVQRQISTNCFFKKITKIPSPSLPGLTSFTPQSHFISGVFIMTFVIVTSSARERELYSMCAPARALSLTKPND